MEGQLTVQKGATCTFQAPGGAASTPIVFKGSKPLLDNSGFVDIESGAKVQFTPAGGNGAGGGFSQNDSKAVTRLWAGSAITCGQQTEVDIHKGKLRLVEVADKAGAQDPITISGTAGDDALYIGLVGILEHASRNDADVTTRPKTPLVLDINGRFSCDGTSRLFAKRSADEHDWIHATGHASYEANSKFTFYWFMDDDGTPRPPDATWEMVTSDIAAIQNQEDPVTYDNTHFDYPPGVDIAVTSFRSVDKQKIVVKRVAS